MLCAWLLDVDVGLDVKAGVENGPWMVLPNGAVGTVGTPTVLDV